MHNTPSVMRFKASNDTLIHWLKNWRSIWGLENKLIVCQVENGDGCAGEFDSNISFIHTEFPIKITDPVFEDWANHPTLLLCDVLAGQMVNIFKMARVFRFGYNKHGELFSLSICCRHSGYALLFFPPEHFSPLRWYSETSLQRTPSGPQNSVRYKEVSVFLNWFILLQKPTLGCWGIV